MVKPTLPYLDILSAAQTLAPDHPLACYQVSGEYAMIVAGADKGIYGLEEMVMETMDSFLRAGTSLPLRSLRDLTLMPSAVPGATVVLTYFTPLLLDILDKQS